MFFGRGEGAGEGGLGEEVVDDIVPGVALLDHPIDGAPVGQASEVAVVDEQIGLGFAGEMGVVIGGLLGVVAVDGVELQAALAAPLDGVVQELALPDGPQDEEVAVLAQHLQGVDGEGELLADGGVLMGDDGAVEVDCDNHWLRVKG